METMLRRIALCLLVVVALLATSCAYQSGSEPYVIKGNHRSQYWRYQRQILEEKYRRARDRADEWVRNERERWENSRRQRDGKRDHDNDDFRSERERRDYFGQGGFVNQPRHQGRGGYVIRGSIRILDGHQPGPGVAEARIRERSGSGGSRSERGGLAVSQSPLQQSNQWQNRPPDRQLNGIDWWGRNNQHRGGYVISGSIRIPDGHGHHGRR